MHGVLRSWAIPKGPSMDASQKRLAVLVDDHPLSYINFEGIIPEGRYGAGAVVIWDKGTFDLIEEKKDKISFSIKGKKLKGNFILVRMKGKEKEWLLIKQKDEYAKNSWKLENSLTPEKKAKIKVKIPPCDTS
jgi:bifunctional non-homologous end joining protein LigD